VDGARDGSGLRGVADHPDSKWALGNSDRLPTWSMDVANCRFDVASGTIAAVEWNDRQLRVRSPSAILTPAYIDGQCVEYYSRTHGIWLLADIRVKLMGADEKGAQLWANYTVTMHNSRQRRPNVGLSCLRTVLVSGEPCEHYVTEQDRWVPGSVVRALHDGAVPGYELELEEATEVPTIMANSVLVRRRYPAGAQAVVYRGLARGWVNAEVLEPHALDNDPSRGPAAWTPMRSQEQAKAAGQEADEFALGAPVLGAIASDATVVSVASAASVQSTATSASGRRPRKPRKGDGAGVECWARVPLREVEDAAAIRHLVPSYLVRLHPEELAKLAMQRAALQMDVTPETTAEVTTEEAPEDTETSGAQASQTGWCQGRVRPLLDC